MVFKILLDLIISFVLAFVLHEGAHYLTALVLGYNINYKFEFGYIGKIPIPRGVWVMPDTTKLNQKIIAVSGFATEILFIIPLTLIWFYLYPLIVAIHFILYPFYAKNANDFKWLI